MIIREGLTYDDVLLVPKHSTITSRKDVDISSDLTSSQSISVPIISANMDTVTEVPMAQSMFQLGGLGILHRFMSIEENVKQITKLATGGGGCRAVNHVAFSIGINGEAKERLEACINAGGNVVCVDVAHGYHERVWQMINYISVTYPSVKIIAGNVATGDGARYLASAGAHAIKVGVGPGSLCTTRVVTGHGVPQLTALLDVVAGLKALSRTKDVKVIADGGIKKSGDIVKALAAGADTVMIGSLFAGTTETPGEIIINEKNKKFKSYRGMASKEAQEDWKGYVSVVEGESQVLPYKGNVSYVFNQLLDGIRSGLSYSGARNIKELRANAEFIRITNSGLVESRPHGL